VHERSHGEEGRLLLTFYMARAFLEIKEESMGHIGLAEVAFTLSNLLNLTIPKFL